MRRRIIAALLALLLAFAVSATALGEDNSRSFTFDLSVNGAHEVHVQPGEIVTVTLTLRRGDSGDVYTMFAMQDEIRYDDAFLHPVPHGSIVYTGIETRDIALRDGDRAYYMNFVSFTDGLTWNADQIIGTFQIQVDAAAGATVLKNENYKVSLRDGTERYAAGAEDLTLIVSDVCTVRFETNGGSALPEQTVKIGDTVKRPGDPVREGYRLTGWYSDIDLTSEWDFRSMTVRENMTLYAAWAEGTAAPKNIFVTIGDFFADLFGAAAAALGTAIFGTRIPVWGLLLFVGALLLLLLLLLRGKHTVRFETNGGEKIAAIRVRHGDTLDEDDLPVPVRAGRVFCGWYKDAALTEPWYFGEDEVRKSIRLYAKWI